MLNNKYLAIGLVIAAAVVVVYQVFFNKPKKPPMRQTAPAVRQTQPAAPPSTGRQTARTAQTSQTQQTSRAVPGTPPQTDEGPAIDAASPILLKRVYENPMEKSSRREVPAQFGRAIFSPPPRLEYEAPTDKKDLTHLQFRLNSIIIDKQRRIAVINNTILFTGETIAGARVESIQKDRVLLKFRERSIVLSTAPGLSTIRLAGGKGDI